MSPGNLRTTVTVLACFAVTACVTEGKRPTRDVTDDSACADRCAEAYPNPPPCFGAVWSTDSCTCSLVAAGEDAPCDDGNACTLEDRCSGSTCSGQLVDLRTFCDDGDDCTVDNCDQNQGCVNDPVEVAVGVEGGGQLCDDGNQCSFDSRCNELGQCRWTNQYICGVCDPTEPDGCAEENLAQDLCDGRLTCVAGFCEVDRKTVPACADPRLDPCLVPGCDEGDCTTSPLPDDTACSDLSSCTKGDVCQRGSCVGTPVDVAACACDAPEDCAGFEDDDLCNGTMTCRAGVCVFDFTSIVVCDTSSDGAMGSPSGLLPGACAATRCVPATGVCATEPAADDSHCDDGDPCTLSDVCSGGECAGSERDCSASDGRCLVGVCDRLLGCVAEVVEPGTACVPSEPCTSGGTCDEAGDCTAPRVGCDDGDACTSDVCNEATGECQFVGPDQPACGEVGVCAGGVPLRCELGEYQCDFRGIAGWSAVEKCDGKDDDCDGATDEACIAGEACEDGTLLAAWSGTMQACTGTTTVAAASCGTGWHVCSYSSMVDSLGGDNPPAGYYIAASIAFSPGAGYSVNDHSGGDVAACFEFDGVCTNAREVQAMSWDGVFGSTVAYAAEAWGCDGGVPAESCATVVFAGVMCCADECDSDSDCGDASACTSDSCVAGRCENLAGNIPVCTTSGVCSGLEPTCESDGTLACRYSAIAGWEAIESSCDGLDNDCDGRTDAADQDFQPAGEACELQAGVCAGATRRAGACVEGVWSLCGAGDYSARSAHYEDAFEGLCDGRDNNCDGQVDGGFAWHGGNIGEACDGVGACGPGVVECAPSRAAVVCSTNPLGSASQAAAEQCNNSDDDCDGETDEAADLDVDASDCGRAGVCLGLPVARCAGGAWVCDSAGIPGYGSEICDGLDNDCDGATDEGFTASGRALGAPCGPSSCPNGVVICTANGAAAACSSDVDASMELCDGVDNDCEGGTDESLVYFDLILGARNVGQPCSGRGACGGGTVECGSRLRATCSTLIDGSDSEAIVERCNGIDDDCDGLTDEGFSWRGTALGQQCAGVGMCGVGVVVCSSDAARATCSTLGDGTASKASAETCDGQDDDCDGATDEGVVASASDCPSEGVCRPEMLDARCTGIGGWQCDYSASGYYQSGNEAGRCDRLDNDCDGTVDEDFPTLGASCDGPDPDLCALGTTLCDPNDPTKTTCAADHARAEICNGQDDDCDGLTDEPGAAGCTLFYNDLDGDQFGTTDSRCTCAAFESYTALVAGDCLDGVGQAFASVNPAAPEVCNGVDDDCDGKTDAADAADLVVDDVEPCPLQVGVCHGTNKNANRCVEGRWQDCQAADYLARNAAFQLAKETRCDGLDNDCDGAVDGGDSDIIANRPLCELQQGQCNGAAKPLTLCTAQGWGTCTTAVYLAHAAAYEAGIEVSCDGKDNECDGFIDDEFAFTGKKVGQSCDGTGACGNGLVECAADGSSATCSTNADGSQHQDVAETCNGVDDDCDGATDDGLGLAQSPCRKVGVCTAERVVATCSQGNWTCDYGAVVGYESSVELSCDERDNDCDGATDEDLSLTTNGQTLRKGDPCGAGSCSGAVVCNGGTPAPGDLICSAEVAGGAEVCDALDNDCDGQTDEGLSWTPVGLTPIALGAACDGYGACGMGVVECSDNLATACSTNPDGSDSEEELEVCNGLDDDCDRVPDDGFAWHGSAVGQPCDGVGECGVGVVECLTSGTASTCSTNPDGTASGDTAETCNGKDDDCDGDIDEGLDVDDSPCSLTGVCTRDTVSATCDGADGWLCDYSDVPYYHAGDEVAYCDGRDNDCDSATDEDYPELGAPCDVATDSDLCTNGRWACLAVATDATTPPANTTGPTGVPACVGDTPSPETCSSGDNDCDGVIDEEGAIGCDVYFRDSDKDGFGVGNDFKCLCAPFALYTVKSTSFDCDDLDADINPDADEVCNEADDDCDGTVDNDDTEGCEDYYRDGDRDGWGLDNDSRCLCFDYQGDATDHTTQLDGDCDDGLASVHPEATEICDGHDNDCDGKADDEDPPVGGCTTFFYDNDGDSYGVSNSFQCRCLPGDKFTAPQGGDCCDIDARAKPLQASWYATVNQCSSFDYNCNGLDDLEVTTYGGCNCNRVLDLCTTACTWTPGWSQRFNGTVQAIPQCSGQGKFVTGCSATCEATEGARTQRCH